MKKWLKEPLLHFLIIGALIFVVFSIVNKDEITVSENKIVVSIAEIEKHTISPPSRSGSEYIADPSLSRISRFCL